jgi:hypothetical protein
MRDAVESNVLRGIWGDPDRRRALLLSLFVHLAMVLLLAFYLNLPAREPVETFLVIEVGTPALAETPTEAPAAADPAPVAPAPQVADPVPGEPQAVAASDPVTAAPEASPETVQPEAPAAQVEPVPATEPTPIPAEVPAPPAPQAALPQPPTPALPTDITPSTALPEIDSPQVEPLPIAETVQIPAPAASTEVAPAQLITPTPSVEVAAAQPVPQPDFSAAVAAPEPVPTPAVQATVAPQRAVPSPDIEATVVAPRSVSVQPQVAVARPRPIPIPQIAAAVSAPEPTQAAPPAQADAPAGASEVASVRSDDRPAGGDADRPGQTTADDGATADGLGAAADPQGGEASGAPAQPPLTPFSERRTRPVAVMIDNADGYPQSGLARAGLIVEMPVEGGLTRLMAVFDRADPGTVGPVRSARDYFVELSQAMGGVLVHDGGSPGAMAAIARAPLPTLNAYTSGELFSRRGERNAPYNLYSAGTALREAVNRLELDRSRLVQGVVYRPGPQAAAASDVTVRFSSIYDTGFRYLPELNLYRWVRNGAAAVDAAGEAVLVDAVVIAAIDARPLPNDDAGRLYIPLRGGPATLLLRGSVVEGSWRQDGGVRFFDGDGVESVLDPCKTWIALTPVYERAVLR